MVSKKSRFTIEKNENKELVQTRFPTKIRVSIDYRKLNAATRKDHFARRETMHEKWESLKLSYVLKKVLLFSRNYRYS